MIEMKFRSLGLLVVLPSGITFASVRMVMRQFRLQWPAKIQNVCQEISGEIPGKIFTFR